MIMDRILITKSMIPYSFRIVLAGTAYTLKISYNALAGMFTIGLSNENEVLTYGEPIIYNQVLFQDIRNLKFPKMKIVPYDESGKKNVVTYDNFGRSVFLVIDNGGDSIE